MLVGDGISMHTVIDGLSGYPQFSCNFGYIAIMDIEKVNNLLFFPITTLSLAILSVSRGGLRRCDRFDSFLTTEKLGGQLVDGDHPVDRQIGGALDNILQFPDIAWPPVGIEIVHQVLVDGDLMASVATQYIEKMIEKKGNILNPFP